MEIVNENWQEEIRYAFEEIKDDRDYLDQDGWENENLFLGTIWEMSMTAFDTEREVQVVIDGNDNIYSSFGSPSFVEFTEAPIGMKLPIKCWIHTHPFGKAYFSGTDWRTIKTWEPVMEQAIVLGDNEKMVWNNFDKEYTLFFANVDIPNFDRHQTLLVDFEEEE